MRYFDRSLEVVFLVYILCFLMFYCNNSVFYLRVTTDKILCLRYLYFTDYFTAVFLLKCPRPTAVKTEEAWPRLPLRLKLLWYKLHAIPYLPCSYFTATAIIWTLFFILLTLSLSKLVSVIDYILL